MRHLLQPRVLNQAALAAAASSLACYPQFVLWLKRPEGLVVLEFTLFVCATVLWGFVFAWHEPYAGRPVFVKPDSKSMLAVTALGLIAAVVYGLGIDPVLRPLLPEEYPADMSHWVAATLFALTLTQLFQVFAPYDWFMRLARHHRAALIFTALFGAAVQVMKIRSLHVHLSPGLLTTLVLMRIVGGGLAVIFYLRGGVLLVGWWTLLVQMRHLLYLDLGF